MKRSVSLWDSNRLSHLTILLFFSPKQRHVFGHRLLLQKPTQCAWDHWWRNQLLCADPGEESGNVVWRHWTWQDGTSHRTITSHSEWTFSSRNLGQIRTYRLALSPTSPRAVSLTQYSNYYNFTKLFLLHRSTTSNCIKLQNCFFDANIRPVLWSVSHKCQFWNAVYSYSYHKLN